MWEFIIIGGVSLGVYWTLNGSVAWERRGPELVLVSLKLVASHVYHVSCQPAFLVGEEECPVGRGWASFLPWDRRARPIPFQDLGVMVKYGFAPEVTIAEGESLCDPAPPPRRASPGGVWLDA
ncbi:hypothetical protein PspLS_09993 [Pyricularia sp. CBS 133598]|nr:hypothetical protein PspLS_09993 [Pyricularia sp. CBS 133598]